MKSILTRVLLTLPVVWVVVSLVFLLIHYWRDVLHGDLGRSIRLNDSVLHLISTRYPYTIELTIAALVLGLALAVPAGVLAATRRARWQDRTLGLVNL
jgi:ABC-type dipeptide/oligopeptide/nickel transport system permease component